MKEPSQINYNNLTARIFGLQPGDTQAFERLALEAFELQYNHNALYRAFCNNLSKERANVTNIFQIPFLPISFFKTRRITTDLVQEPHETVFTSSGTSQTGVSSHYVTDVGLYEKSFLRAFDLFYGAPSDHCILGLLPSYLERNGSSLVYMTDKLIQLSKHPLSNFYLNNYNELIAVIEQLKQQKQRTLLLGVSYALLDLAEKNVQLDENFVVMETGGMKGKREEMPKSELQQTLMRKLGVKQVHSEYGMTELLSQAYSKEQGQFTSPPWMQVLIHDTNDPFSYLAAGRTGGINIIDLANINSCCFISTQDLGRQNNKGMFELMGRFDNSDIRGCNLLVE